MQFDFNIDIKTNHLKHAYIVKNNVTDEIVFTGVDTLKNIITLNTISNLPSFNPRVTYRVSVLGEFLDHGQAENFIHYKYGDLSPVLNRELYERDRYKSGKIILCNETRQYFLTQSATAKYFNISQSNLSKHLRNYPGFPACKGFTFKFLEPDKAQKLINEGVIYEADI